MMKLRKTSAELNDTINARSNNSLDASGMSLAFIDNLNQFVDTSRRVNSSVMSPLRMKPKMSSAAPQLNETQLVWIIRSAARRMMRIESSHAESTWHSSPAITLRQKMQAFGAAEQGATT